MNIVLFESFKLDFKKTDEKKVSVFALVILFLIVMSYQICKHCIFITLCFNYVLSDFQALQAYAMLANPIKYNYKK